MEEEVLLARRQPNDYRVAKFFAKDVDGFHWDKTSGGVNRNLTQYFVHAYVVCNAMIEGEIGHSGIHGSCPHRIKVVLLKKDNLTFMPKILEKIGPRPGTKAREAWKLSRQR